MGLKPEFPIPFHKKFNNRQLFIIALILTLVTGAADIITTAQYQLVPLYLIPIFISTYYGSTAYGAFISTLSAAFFLITHYTETGIIEPNDVWNTLMTFIIYIFILFLIKILKEYNLKMMEEESKHFEEIINITQRDLEEKEAMIREIHHRMKNNMTNLIALIGIMKDEKVELVLDELIGRINTFLVLYDMLSYSSSIDTSLSLRKYIEKITGLILKNSGLQESGIECNMLGSDIHVDPKKATLLGLIINELATNTLKHGRSEHTLNRIDITIESEKDGMIIIYRDNGPGLNINDLRSSDGHIGMMLIDIITKQLKGSLRLPDNGSSEFKFTFPMSAVARLAVMDGTE